jgi:haloacetate dehalogenase
MFEGFTRRTVEANGISINLVIGGKGPPVLLLHGYPQSHVMWHRLTPMLAERFTVVASDLRGYGDSAKPKGDEAHRTYSKRTMAADQCAVMRALGFERFCVVGHDRGARVAHRMTLDHAARVEKVAFLDIIPTLTAFELTNEQTARGYYHWFFLSQPFDLPERLIGHEPAFFLHWCLKAWGGAGLDYFGPEALAAYERAFADPATIHASCEDYRAAASIDLEHDRADLDRKVGCPALALWGARGRLGRWYDVLATWQARCTEVRGRAIDAGHFLAEEKPAEVARDLLAFLGG